MFPYKDHNPSYKTPYITYILIGVCCIVWLYELSLGTRLDDFFQIWALQATEIIKRESLFTLITSMFLHGSWMHIIWNMLFLYIFGDNLEAKMWHLKFLVFYLFCWLCASWAQIYSDIYSTIPNLWASWAIAGVMGWYLLLYPKARIDSVVFLWYYIRKVTLPAFLMLGYWFALQVFSGVWSAGSEWWGVAYWAHVWWFVAGVIWILPYYQFRKKRKK